MSAIIDAATKLIDRVSGVLGNNKLLRDQVAQKSDEVIRLQQMVIEASSNDASDAETIASLKTQLEQLRASHEQTLAQLEAKAQEEGEVVNALNALANDLNDIKESPESAE